MASIISASTTSGTALSLTADTSGVLEIKTGVTPTTAMTIDGSQNVGIGTSSPAANLHVRGGSGAAVRVSNIAGTTYTSILNDGIYSTGTDLYIFAPSTYANIFYAGGSERMRIDSSGNVGIGTSTITSGAGWTPILVLSATSAALVVKGVNGQENSFGNSNGLYIDCLGNSTATNNNIIFRNTASNSSYSATERMRINSDGYFKASNNASYVSSTGAYHEFTNTASSEGLIVRNTNASQAAASLEVWAARNTTDNSFYALTYYNTGAAAYRFRVADSGNVTNTNGSYGTISDIKNKENIVDATPKLDKVNQLKVRNYNFIGDDLKQIGFVAQEFEQVFPSMVEQHPDRDEEGNDLGTTTKSIKTSVLVPILVKAIQELNVKVEAQAAEIAALKGAQ